MCIRDRPRTDHVSIIRNYTLASEDLDIIGKRRGAVNRLGIAAHLALLRHPGFGLRVNSDVPEAVLNYLAVQLELSPHVFETYGQRAQTRTDHSSTAAEYLGLQPFARGDIAHAIELAARAAMRSDRGETIARSLMDSLKADRFILPLPDTLERSGLAGRARALTLQRPQGHELGHDPVHARLGEPGAPGQLGEGQHGVAVVERPDDRGGACEQRHRGLVPLSGTHSLIEPCAGPQCHRIGPLGKGAQGMSIVAQDQAWCATTPKRSQAVDAHGSALKSVGSALDVLECFATDGELGVSDIARRLGVAKSTALSLIHISEPTRPY